MSKMLSDFTSIIRRYGHNVALQRRSQSTDGPVTYLTKLEVHTTRFSIYNNRGLQNAQQEQMEGILNTSGRVYYFLPDVIPYEGDRIYEMDFRNSRYETIWTIEQAVPMRGLGGEIIYWACGCGRTIGN